MKKSQIWWTLTKYNIKNYWRNLNKSWCLTSISKNFSEKCQFQTFGKHYNEKKIAGCKYLNS